MKLPPYDTFPEIFSKKIVLREVQSSDIKDIVEISFYDAQPALTVEEATEIQIKINQDYQKGTSIHWGIADAQTNVIVGTLGFYRGFEKGAGELGCVLRPEFHGKGFMTIAMKLVIEFGFSKMELIKIIAITTKQNINAVKLLRRLDFIEAPNLQEDPI
jgi:ribosomal-protein-alanine N-acetyltransferase